MTEVKISKKTNEYLKEGNYHTILVTLERDCSCIGNNITGLRIELLKEREKEKQGYVYIKADKYNLLVDKKLICKPKIAIYLNESKIGNILDIEGIEL